MPHTIHRMHAVQEEPDDPPVTDAAAIAAKAVRDLEEELKKLSASLTTPTEGTTP